MGDKLDDQSIRNQLGILHEETKYLRGKLIEVMVEQKAIKKAHDKLEKRHEGHGDKISKHRDWIIVVGAGAMVVLYIMDKMGLFGKIMATP